MEGSYDDRVIIIYIYIYKTKNNSNKNGEIQCRKNNEFLQSLNFVIKIPGRKQFHLVIAVFSGKRRCKKIQKREKKDLIKFINFV